MSWASRRRTTYLGFLITVIVAVSFSIFYFFIYEKPNCFDDKRNQDEQGVDCGGACTTICTFDVADPVVLWSRTFKVKDGLYNAFALVENPNFESVAYNVPYSFKAYDDKNILIYEKNGVIDIPSHSRFSIFNRSIYVGERIPAKTFFEFTEEPKWVTSKEKQPDLFIKNKILTKTDTSPRLEVTIENKTIKTIEDIEVTAMIFDKNDNVINISQTFIDSLLKNSSETVFFTWSEPFNSEYVRIEVIPIVK